jgi:hypothetical protein
MYLSKSLNFSAEGFIMLIYSLSFFFLTRGLSNIFSSNVNYFLCVLLFLSSSAFFLLYSNVIRQGLGASILIYILSVSTKKTWLKIIMPFIHKGTLVYFLRKLFYIKSLKKRVVFMLIAIASPPLMNHIIALFEFTGLKMIDFYLNTFERESSYNSLTKLFILVSTNILFFVFSRNFIKNNKEQAIYYTYFAFSMVTILFFNIDGIFSRLNFFCMFLAFPLHILLIKYLAPKIKGLYFLGLIFFNLSYSVYVLTHPSIIENLELF